MARIKYASGIDPLNHKHYGYTFQQNHYGQTMATSARNTGTRSALQLLRMKNLQRAQTYWRTMTPETQANWSAYAAAYPQPAHDDPSRMLSGYEIFIKRNHYCFLNFDLNVEFITTPEMISLPEGAPVFSLAAGANVIDVTETYLARFGRLPAVGQQLEFLAIPYSENSGQFFDAIHSLLNVDEVYIDGLFLSIDMPVVQPNITYSVYLSKPVSEGYTFPGTNVRYMGCFTTKTFLGLSDTPSTYAGAASKVVSVKADASGLEFTTPSAGGLTCADLPLCPTIISIQAAITAINNTLIFSVNTSIPTIKNGYLYNSYTPLSAKALGLNGFVVIPYDTYGALLTYLGLASGRAWKIMEKNIDYWLTITSNTNIFKLNLRGSSYRDAVGFNVLKYTSQVFIQYPTPGYMAWFICTDNTGTISANATNSPIVLREGRSIRLCKPAPGVADGTIGTYVSQSGQIYRTIVINQVQYLADNLKETTFADGTPIPNVTGQAAWNALSTPAYCSYNNVEYNA